MCSWNKKKSREFFKYSLNMIATLILNTKRKVRLLVHVFHYYTLGTRVHKSALLEKKNRFNYTNKNFFFAAII